MAGRYLIFRCQHCGHFTFSPVGQKTRLCSYCGKIIKINTAYALVVDDKYKAMFLVKKFNAKNGWREFKRILEVERDKILCMIEKIEEAEETERKGEPIITVESSKMRRLLKLLKECCQENPLHLEDFKKLCGKYGLEEGWALAKVETLSREGVIIFPDPWHIKYVGGEVEGIVISRKRKATSKIRRSKNPVSAIVEVFRRQKIHIKYEDLRAYMLEEGFSDEQIDSALRMLLNRGMIIERSPGIYEWVGD